MSDDNTFPKQSKNDLLALPLQFIKGVGPVRAKLLERLHLTTMQDLIFHFPIAHKDRASVTPLKNVRAGSDVNVLARIIDVRGKRFAGREKVEALLQDESGQLRAGWWNPWIADKLTPNAWGFFSGKVTLSGDKRELSNAEFEILTEPGDATGETATVATGPSFGRIVPFYNLRPKQRLPSGEEAPEIRITQGALRKLIWQAIEAGAAQRLPEQLPPELIRSLHLMGHAEALQQIHFPDSLETAADARRRLVFEELFIISIGVAMRRVQIERLAASRKLPLARVIEERIHARLPFKLTQTQSRAFREIAKDMGQDSPMNRLLQGDVGSGKTAVAVSALLLAVAHGTQAVFLAPTEVLAEQHYRTLTKMLNESRVKIGLLRGGSKEGERRSFLAELADGTINIAVGTHALLEENVIFKSLALVVVDEQHKFGVEQRQALRSKGRAPHVLVMTATPIPRTLTLTLYGDLDVSRIDQPPPGRGEIVTRRVNEIDRAKVYKLIVDEARKGNATYIVLPRIDSDGVSAAPSKKASADETFALSAGRSPLSPPGRGAGGEGRSLRKVAAPKKLAKKLWSEVKGVEEEFKRMREHLPTLRMDMLHGRMSSEDKDTVLTKLREGKIDVLVSTQVIEVGIDLPSATVMLIENAEMFGLAALHQLRGRVGRSERKSYCLLFGEPTTEEGVERLETLVKTRDGFKIAEVDFALRGPGQFFGTNQSGMPELKIADLLRDTLILVEARDAAFALVRADPLLVKVEHQGIKQRVRDVLGARLRLIDVG